MIRLSDPRLRLFRIWQQKNRKCFLCGTGLSTRQLPTNSFNFPQTRSLNCDDPNDEERLDAFVVTESVLLDDDDGCCLLLTNHTIQTVSFSGHGAGPGRGRGPSLREL